MNTSGERISSALRDLGIYAEPVLTADADTAALLDFCNEGTHYRTELASVVHGELDPTHFAKGDMRRWLRTAWQTIEAARRATPHIAESQAFLRAAREMMFHSVRVRAGLGEGEEGLLEEQAAIGIAMTGADLLIAEASDPDLFPAAGSEAREAGMGALQDSLGTEECVNAAIFLAHALLTYRGLTFDRLHAEGNKVSAVLGDGYRVARDLGLGDLFPLPATDATRLDQCSHVYRVFDGLRSDSDWPEVPGYPTPFCLATAIELRDPAVDDGQAYLVDALKGTRRTAEKFFVVEGLKHALHICVGPESYGSLVSGLAIPDGFNFGLDQRLTMAQSWARYSGALDENVALWHRIALGEDLDGWDA